MEFVAFHSAVEIFLAELKQKGSATYPQFQVVILVFLCSLLFGYSFSLTSIFAYQILF